MAQATVQAERTRIQHRKFKITLSSPSYYKAVAVIQVVDVYDSQGQNIADCSIVEIESTKAPAEEWKQKKNVFKVGGRWGIPTAQLTNNLMVS